MKKICLLLMLAAACKTAVDDRDANYNLMLAIAHRFQEKAESYKHDHTPAGTKHFADNLDSVTKYLDSAKTFWTDRQKEQDRYVDSLVKSDMRSDKKYNDSVYAARKGK